MSRVTFPALLAMVEKNNIDSILLLESSTKADVRMRILEKDGTESVMCGNGARVVSKLLIETYGVINPRIEAGGKIFNTENLGNGEVAVNMGVAQIRNDNFCLVGGEPHLLQTDDISFDKLHRLVKENAVNVNLVDSFMFDGARIRTFERGVNDFTKCCGTGSVAVANLLRQKGYLENEFNIYSPGGVLNVIIDAEEQSWMTGPAKIYGSMEC